MDCSMPSSNSVQWVGDAIQPPHSLSPSSVALNLPSTRVFSNKLVLCIGWLGYWSFSFSISPSNEYSGLSSFRIDWFDLLVVQWTLKSLQHYSSKASVLQCSAFFMVQHSHLYMTGKTIVLTIETFGGKVMSLLLYVLIYDMCFSLSDLLYSA